MARGGIGERLLRKEDARFLEGRGQYVSDIALPGMLHAAFLRSPHAHARIKSVRKPRGQEHRVFVAADLEGVKPIRSSPNFAGFQRARFSGACGRQSPLRRRGGRHGSGGDPRRRRGSDPRNRGRLRAARGRCRHEARGRARHRRAFTTNGATISSARHASIGATWTRRSSRPSTSSRANAG